MTEEKVDQVGSEAEVSDLLPCVQQGPGGRAEAGGSPGQQDQAQTRHDDPVSGGPLCPHSGGGQPLDDFHLGRGPGGQVRLRQQSRSYSQV